MTTTEQYTSNPSLVTVPTAQLADLLRFARRANGFKANRSERNALADLDELTEAAMHVPLDEAAETDCEANLHDGCVCRVCMDAPRDAAGRIVDPAPPVYVCEHAEAVATAPCCAPLRILMRSHGIDAATVLAAISTKAADNGGAVLQVVADNTDPF